MLLLISTREPSALQGLSMVSVYYSQPLLYHPRAPLLIQRLQLNLQVLMYYYFFGTSFGPIEYKGPMSAVYIEKFVRRVMTPLLYISSRSKLLDFLSDYEVLVSLL